MRIFFFQAKWRLLDNNLSNKAGITLTGKWKIEGRNIINAENVTKGFGVVNDAKAARSKVSVDETLSDPDDPGQQWEKSTVDSLGYFTLKNPNSGKFLSAITAEKIIIQGTEY